MASAGSVNTLALGAEEALMKLVGFLLILAAVFGFAWAAIQDPVAMDMEEGARRFLGSLEPQKRDQATIAFTDEERYNFHYIPRDREGVPEKAMTPAQRKLSHSLLASGLSHQGMRRAFDIMYLDQILYEKEKRAIRDPDAYYFTIFGEPAPDTDWGWRVEGHHLSLNFTLHQGRVVSSFPSFWGANPAIVLEGPQKGMRVLAEEELLGRSLLSSFDERGSLMIASEAPSDIVTQASRRAEIGRPAGVAADAMSPFQRQALHQLIALYAERLRPELAASEMERIEAAGFDNVHFAWAGGAAAGEPHYYRIQGPTFLIEYDNTQNGANHIHTVWRDPSGDWGDSDPISEHYARSPHHRHPHDVRVRVAH